MEKMLSGLGYTIVPRLSYGARTKIDHVYGEHVRLRMLQVSYITISPRAWLEKIFYQSFVWHWDTTSRQLERDNHPPWYNAAGLELIAEYDFGQDTYNMAMKHNPRIELQFERGYHQNMMQLSAIDAHFYRLIDDAVMKWLIGGPRPRNAVLLSPESRPYLTREATRSLEGVGELLRARQGLQWHGGLDPANPVAIDLNSDSDYEFLYNV